MAESFTSVPGILKFQLGASDVATLINFPNAARKFSVKFFTNVGKLALDGDDDAPISATAITGITADVFFELVVSKGDQRGPASVRIAAAVGNTNVECVCESA